MQITETMCLDCLNDQTLGAGAPDEVLAMRDALVREHLGKDLASLPERVLGELINRTLAALPE